MKISLKWINDFVDITGIDPHELALTLTVKTAEIEGVYIKAEHFSGILAGEILDAEKIDDSHYKCTVLADKKYTVISGAPNTRIDLKAFFVKPGGRLNDVEIGDKIIAGVKSSGMLLSLKELGIGNDHSGIYELPPETAAGTDIGDICDFYDSIIEIDNKSLTHRPDLWGLYGFAREISAICSKPLKDYEIYDINSINSGNIIPIEIEDSSLCFRYAGIKIDNIRAIPSPLNVQVRLAHTEHVPRNAIVDLTNYVMTELGQPMHSFDGSCIRKIRIAPLKKKIMYKTLDDTERELPVGTLMIDNQDGHVAIAGIMGGGNSEISESSNSLFLESASFDAASIRKTSSFLGLRTDSSARFEKSLDPENALKASLRYIRLLKSIQPDIIFASTLNDDNYNPFSRNTVDISCSSIRRIMGSSISDEQIIAILTSLQFSVKNENGVLTVTAPTFRSTKDISIKEDIVEEVARIYGYENIESKLPSLDIAVPEFNRERQIEHSIRDMLSNNEKMNEIETYSWFNNAFLKDLKYSAENPVLLSNPVSSENTVMRDSLLPNMLMAVMNNLKFYDEFSLFEMGSVYFSKTEKRKLGIITVRKKSKNGEQEAFMHMKKIIINLFSSLAGIEASVSNMREHSLMNPAICASIEAGGVQCGYTGTVHPSFNSLLDKKVNMAYCELELSVLSHYRKDSTFSQFSQFPITRIDFSVMKPDSMIFSELNSIIGDFKDALILGMELIDVYSGDSIEKGFSSVTFRFTLGSHERTLTADDLNAFQSSFMEYIKRKGLRLR